MRIATTVLAAAAQAAAPQASDYDQGVALIGQGQAEAAIPLLTRATQAHPRDARAWKALGVAYASGARYERAESAFAKACELAPRLEDACYYQGRALYAVNRFEASLAALERAGSGCKVRLGMGQALEALGRASDAEARFRQAVELCGGTDPSPSAALGLFLLRQGRWQEAVVPLSEVLRRFPNAADAHTHLGRALLERGDLAEAAAHLERAVALAPTSAQAHLLLAKAYVRTGRATEAQEHFAAAARYEAASQGATP